MTNFDYEMPVTRLKKYSILSSVIDAGSKGVTIRELSEKCDLSIYSVRNWIQHLVNEGTILKDSERIPKYRYFNEIY